MARIPLVRHLLIATALLGACEPPPDSAAIDGALTQDAGAVPFVALAGCPQYVFTAPVIVGAQTFHLVVDTGSTTLAVASSACSNCTGVSPLYTPSASATDTHKPASERFGDGSGWSGDVYLDNVAIDPFPATQLSLVGMAAQTRFILPFTCPGGSLTNYEGIIGFGAARLALANTNGYLDQLVRSGTPDLFALSLCDGGGRLWLGGYDATAASTPVQFTPMVGALGYYAVSLSDARVGATSPGFAASDFGSAIVDIGTSNLLVPAATLTRLATAIEADPGFSKYFGTGDTLFGKAMCVAPSIAGTRDEIDAALPALTLVIPSATAGSTIEIHGAATQTYLFASVDAAGNDVYCPALGVAPRGAGIGTIIGSAILRTQLTVIDRARQRVGFAPVKGCE